MSLKHSILAVLSTKERTGYEITHKVDASVGFFWTATHQQIYRELAQLEKNALIKHRTVKQTDKPNKKVYRITKAGTEELKRWILEPVEPSPSKDALLVKLFVGHMVDAKPLLDEMIHLREAHAEKYKRYLAIEEEHFSKSNKLSLDLKYQYVTLRRGISFEKGWLSWADEAIEFLKGAARSSR